MVIGIRERDGVVILEPKGKITIGAAEEELRDAVDRALEGASRNLLVDMEHVPIVDSSGLGRLLAARTTVVNRGGNLKLLRLPPAMHDLLQMTQLLTLFDVFDDEEEAVSSFAPTS
jgi:anti-sigma B factor antagonist